MFSRGRAGRSVPCSPGFRPSGRLSRATGTPGPKTDSQALQHLVQILEELEGLNPVICVLAAVLQSVLL